MAQKIYKIEHLKKLLRNLVVFTNMLFQFMDRMESELVLKGSKCMKEGL